MGRRGQLKRRCNQSKMAPPHLPGMHGAAMLVTVRPTFAVTMQAKRTGSHTHTQTPPPPLAAECSSPPSHRPSYVDLGSLLLGQPTTSVSAQPQHGMGAHISHPQLLVYFLLSCTQPWCSSAYSRVCCTGSFWRSWTFFYDDA